jgi:hypothetical protein
MIFHLLNLFSLRPLGECGWDTYLDQFALSCASYRVSKLAALAQALITLGSVNSPGNRVPY